MSVTNRKIDCTVLTSWSLLDVQMLRITNFGDGQELLLRPRSDGKLFGYIRPKGVIEDIAHAQYQSFIKSKQLVCKMQSAMCVVCPQHSTRHSRQCLAITHDVMFHRSRRYDVVDV